MKTTGTMTSVSTFGGREVESKVSRAGTTVSCEMVNPRGDVIRASMTAEGDLAVTVDRNHQRLGAVMVTASGVSAVLRPSDRRPPTHRDAEGMLIEEAPDRDEAGMLREP